jgi:polysaccharide pyruvyl transferase WcaK-like protein
MRATTSATAGDRNPPLSFVTVRTQFENAGDCIVIRELIRLLSERGDVKIDLGRHGTPQRFVDQVSSAAPAHRLLRAVKSISAPMLMARLRGRRCFWFLVPGHKTLGSRPVSPLSAWMRDLPLLLASAFGVRICQLGASFDGLSATQLKAWTRRRRRLFVLSPRDSISANYLESRGIRCDPCIPDLAFNLFVHASPHHDRRAGPDRAVCISFRTDQYAGQENDAMSVARAVWRATPCDTRWTAVAQVARDACPMQAILRRLKESQLEIEPVLDLHDDVDACLAHYRESSLVVSNRLHVLLMAASQGARILAVAAGPGGAKLRGMLRDVGLEGAILDMHALDRLGGGVQVGLHVEGSAQRARLHRALDAILSGRLPVEGDLSHA